MNLLPFGIMFRVDECFYGDECLNRNGKKEVEWSRKDQGQHVHIKLFVKSVNE